jgi:mannosyl-oligosaccharide alpha-1,3-glucosidase
MHFSGRRGRLLALALLVAAACRVSIKQVECFKEQDFKKCKDSAFCVRMRSVKQPAYAVQPGSVKVAKESLGATLLNVEHKREFALTLTAYDGMLRIHVDEPGNNRYEVKDVLMHNLTPSSISRTGASQAHATLSLGAHTVTLKYSPFQIEVDDVMVLNQRGMFGIEHKRDKQEGDPEGAWEESFKGHMDSKPKGPQAISFDLSFTGFQHAYGLPERATDLNLKPTTGPGIVSEPYRLYNLDVFEYLSDSPFGLYGSIPYLTAHNPTRTVAAFWLNAAEMYVDIERQDKDTATQWFAESGVLDLFLLLGPSPVAVAEQYARLTGTSVMPPRFSIGYHQCR